MAQWSGSVEKQHELGNRDNCLPPGGSVVVVVVVEEHTAMAALRRSAVAACGGACTSTVAVAPPSCLLPFAPFAEIATPIVSVPVPVQSAVYVTAASVLSKL